MNLFQGLLRSLAITVISSQGFQQALIALITGLGATLQSNINNPNKLLQLAEVMQAEPEKFVGIVAAHTEAEPLVDSTIIEDAARDQAAAIKTA
jgi:hypothetical protein